MSELYTFTVNGRAVPQGSKSAFVNRATGRAQLRESSSGHKAWRDLVRLMAQNAPEKPAQPLTGPVKVTLVFQFAYARKHYRTGKHADALRDDAPTWVTTKAIGDIDKLERAVYDAITDAGWIRDDSQIASNQSIKRYTDGAPRVTVRVETLLEPEQAQEALSA